VEGVLSGEIENGFGNKSPAVAASLRHTRGAMLAAAERALENGVGAVAPCSGFHHAGYRYASGFCTFNGLMVTVVSLLARGLARRVGILDLDQHWGDGTHDIIEQLDLHAQVVHFSPARSHYRKEHARRFLVDLPRTLDRFEGCDLVLYQAGADPHVDDPLGGWLTTDQLKERDEIVFDDLLGRRIPVAWNLAGGHLRHRSTLTGVDNLSKARTIGRWVERAVPLDRPRELEELRASAEIEQSVEPEALGLALREPHLVGGNKEWRALTKRRGLDLDEALPSVALKGQHVVAESVSPGFGYVLHPVG
jgi:hypothetical protein